MFDAARFRFVAKELQTIEARFDAKRFVGLSLEGLDDLNLMARMRRMTESLHATLPGTYRQKIKSLRALAPRIGHGFVTLVLPDYVGCHGLDDFEASLEALKFFTAFGSSEFAIREFLRRDLFRTLTTMEKWSRDPSEDVRRLASEGCRPRLPWSFRLDALVADPSPVVPILENLKADPSKYVRKSVANHLNDITKDHPAWVLDRVNSWPLENADTLWIVRHALRTLIKKGDRRALAVVGAGERAQVRLDAFSVEPHRLKLGGRLSFSFRLTSLAAEPQRLVVDYAVHYMKKSGETSAKVFKLKTLTLPGHASVAIGRQQLIKDFTTRVHHPGRHDVEILVNGESLAKDGFELIR